MKLDREKRAGAGSAASFPLAGKRVYVAGHTGLVGGALLRRLAVEDCEVVTAERKDVDLTRQDEARAFLEARRPDCIFVAAAKVGGIHANNAYPADFLFDNLAIAQNVIAAAHAVGTRKLLFLSSSCVYPKNAPQPMREDHILTGALEPTNEWYAIAKIAGMKMCQAYRRQYGADFIAVLPTNLYGPGDNYHPEDSHVPAALLRRFHEAKKSGAPAVAVWGTGRPMREFLYVDDLADACVFLMQAYSGEAFVNVGTGAELSIAAFAALVADTVGYRGEIRFDPTRPDGAPRKLLDVSRLTELGWRARTPLREGLKATYDDFLRGGGRNRSSPGPSAQVRPAQAAVRA